MHLFLTPKSSHLAGDLRNVGGVSDCHSDTDIQAFSGYDVESCYEVGNVLMLQSLSSMA